MGVFCNRVVAMEVLRSSEFWTYFESRAHWISWETKCGYEKMKELRVTLMFWAQATE
jgi:hypothetical protein